MSGAFLGRSAFGALEVERLLKDHPLSGHRDADAPLSRRCSGHVPRHDDPPPARMSVEDRFSSRKQTRRIRGAKGIIFRAGSLPESGSGPEPPGLYPGSLHRGECSASRGRVLRIHDIVSGRKLCRCEERTRKAKWRRPEVHRDQWCKHRRRRTQRVASLDFPFRIRLVQKATR